jgi:catechol 2,3-dioxygenase-like lactoylglutathione lyase family enzyme
MVRTYGLTHLALRVRDPARSARFYGEVVGAKVVYSSAVFVQTQTPGSRDVLVFERGTSGIGKSAGIAHFGFRLRRPSDIQSAIEAVERAGGRVTSHGEFVPGEPYLFGRDLDGYEFELWFELPTPFDPKPRRRATRTRSAR